jgi:hypothetical protein
MGSKPGTIRSDQSGILRTDLPTQSACQLAREAAGKAQILSIHACSAGARPWTCPPTKGYSGSRTNIIRVS